MPKTSDILLFRSLTRNKQYFKKNTPVVNNELPQVLKDKLKSDGKSKKGLVAIAAYRDFFFGGRGVEINKNKLVGGC